MEFIHYISVASKECFITLDLFEDLRKQYWDLFLPLESILCKNISSITLVNENILDLETACITLPVKDVIFVHSKMDHVYIFLIEEMINIIHHDLTRMSEQEDVDYHVTSTIKYFSLPRNPYTNTYFSYIAMRSILSQLLSKLSPGYLSLLTKYPHVICFFRHLKSFYELREDNLYDMTSGIELRFEQFYTKYFWKRRKFMLEKDFLQFINDIQ